MSSSHALVRAVSILAAGTLMMFAVPAHADPDVRLTGEVAAGTLQVRILGLPSGISARVSVTGPTGGGSAREWKFTKSETLKGLTPGNYRVRSRGVKNAMDGEFTVTPKTRVLRITARATSRTRVAYDLPYSELPGRIKNFAPLCKEYLHSDIAKFRFVDKPYTWYCEWENGHTADLRRDQMNDWCNRFFYKGTHIELLGETVWDWWCKM